MKNPSQIAFVIAWITAVATVLTTADAFAISRNQLPSIHQVHAQTSTTKLRSTPTEEEEEQEEEERIELNDTSEKSLLDKVNDFLDTPILDANNRSDQGALAEALKAFVRDEPEIAQVTFSAVVVAILVLLTRVVMSM